MPSRAMARAALILALAVIGCGLASGAWAQAAEAATAAGKVAENFLSRGDYGAIVVALGLVILALVGAVVFLFKKLDGQSSAITVMVKEATAALQANTAATVSGNLTIAALDRTLQATDDGVEKLSRQNELAAQEAKLRGESILENQRSILRRLDDEARRA